MNKTYATSAIILNRKDYKESDRLFILYTKDCGKIDVVATGARKSASKMAKFLEPLMEVELLLAKGKNYDKIAEVKLIDNFTELKQNSRLWALGCYCVEVVDKLTKQEVQQEEIFILLKSILNLLKFGNNNLIQFYILKLLSKLGYCPRLDSCAVCGKMIDNIKTEQKDLVFNPLNGGIACDNCLPNQKNGVKLSFSALDFLRKGLNEELTFFKNIDIKQWESKEVNRAISSFLSFHLDGGLNSARFL